MLQCDICARFEPAILLSRKPIVDTFFESVQFGQRGRPRDLHSEVLPCLATPSDIDAANRKREGNGLIGRRAIRKMGAHEFVEQLAVEVICLRSVKSLENGGEQTDFPHDKIFL